MEYNWFVFSVITIDVAGVSNDHVVYFDAIRSEILDCVERYVMSFSRRLI